ncbi:tetratricopeptide repeat protein [Maribellus mangrovi]|uniref:tetratricopeptide repeat protein n=1 Tax=Maribellus mangrovi TaxID=3133146 RepID=UPI0030EC3D36
MNKRLITIFIYTCILFLGVSCRFQDKKVKPVLESAEALLETHPDSALVILSEIANPKSLQKSLYYEYFLVQIQAKYKCDKDITSDTLIFTIRDYYQIRNNPDEIALATFYGGRVYQEQKKIEKALLQYLDTEQILKQSTNYNLKGLCHSAIGYVYYKQHLVSETIEHYRIAEEYFGQAKNYKNQASSNKFIGNCLLKAEKIDSAFIYYKKGLDIADKYEIRNQQVEIRQSLSVAYREIKDWQQATYFAKEAIEFSTDSLNRAKLAANLGRVYGLQKDSDSAIYYLQHALDYMPRELNNYLAANIYKTWSAIEENENNYKEALNNYKFYSNHLAQIITANKNAAMLEIEEKYNFQLIENQNKQLLIDRQRILLIALVLFLILGLIILYLFKRATQNRRRLKETEQKVRQLNRLAQSFNDKEKSFRNILIEHFDIIKKAALLEGYLKEDERKKGQPLLRRFNEVVYGQKKLNWDILYKTLDKLNNGFFEEFKNKFSQLDESEFRICCLLYVDFNNTEIAILLNYSINTVQAKRTLIRKKLGIKTYGNILDFMKSTNTNQSHSSSF